MYKKYTTFEDTLKAWSGACLNGFVHGPLHANSLLPIIIPQDEVDSRIALATEQRRRQRLQAQFEGHFRNARIESRPRAPTPGPGEMHHDDEDSPSRRISPRSRKRTGSDAGAIRKSSRSPPSSSSSIPSITISTVMVTEVEEEGDNSPTTPVGSRSSTPPMAGQSKSKGKGPAGGLGPRERSTLLAIHTQPVPPPAAWVVIRGIEPGVYRTRYV